MSHDFEDILETEENQCWFSIKEVINGLLGKKRTSDGSFFLNRMMNSFDFLKVHMSLKIHYMHCHVDDFLDQMTTESDEHGERFHQIAAVMEVRYKGKNLDALLGDLCWWITNSFDYGDEEDVEFSDIEEISETSSEEEEGEDEPMNIDLSINTNTTRYDSDNDDDGRPRVPPKRRRTIAC